MYYIKIRNSHQNSIVKMKKISKTEKYSQYIYPNDNLYVEYINYSYTTIKKLQTIQHKWAEVLDRYFMKKKKHENVFKTTS